MSHRVAIVMSEVFLRRLTPALADFVRRDLDFRIVSIHRPLSEIRIVLEQIQPAGLITEWLPEVTDPILKSTDVPTVIVATDLSYPGKVSVDVDDSEVGRVAAQAFQQAGYRSVACLGNELPYSEQRIDGFKAALGDRMKLSVRVEDGFGDARYSESFLTPSADLGTWLSGLPKPVGIFAVHDPLGRFICAAARELGIAVPEEVAVIGANNDALVCQLTHPNLSSVTIPWSRLGSVAGEQMQLLLRGETTPSTPILVPPGGVVLRHSAGHLSVDDDMLRRAMTYLTEHAEQPITVGEMCDTLRIGRRTLEKRFQEHFRCTPWEMLCQLRVNRAKQLLTETNHPISLVAELCGFNDPERMAVVFKRLTGMPPSHHRRTQINS